MLKSCDYRGNEIICLENKTLCYENRLAAKELGRPKPQMCINQEFSDKNRTYKRMFNKSTYEKSEWICGCPVRYLMHLIVLLALCLVVIILGQIKLKNTAYPKTIWTIK